MSSRWKITIPRAASAMRWPKPWRGPEVPCTPQPAAGLLEAENPRNCWNVSGFPLLTLSVPSAPCRRCPRSAPGLQILQLRFLIRGQDLQHFAVRMRARHRGIGFDRCDFGAFFANYRFVDGV